MILEALFLLFGLAATPPQANDLPELKAIEARYDQAQLGKDEPVREKYITELAKLRWQLAHKNQPGWEAVDAEIARHPAPANSDAKVLSKLRIGIWHSPRHDYLFRADGTWVMDPTPGEDTTHGTWSIQNNQYSEEASVATDSKRTYIIILADAANFIIVEPGKPAVYYETRSLEKGLPIRRD